MRRRDRAELLKEAKDMVGDEDNASVTVSTRNKLLGSIARSLIVIADVLTEETKDGGTFRSRKPF